MKNIKTYYISADDNGAPVVADKNHRPLASFDNIICAIVYCQRRAWLDRLFNK